MENIGKRIEIAMSNKGWRQIDLCNATGISKSTLNHYIKGLNSAKADKIYSMAKALDVSEAWLMGYDVPMERQTTLPFYEGIKEQGSYSASIMIKFARLSDVNQKIVENLIDSLLVAQS